MRSKLSTRSFLKNIENFLYKKIWIYNFTVTIVSQKILRTFFVQNSIPYKTYVQEKHVKSIIGTHKNMTKKSIQFEYLQAYSHDHFSKISRTSVQVEISE